MGAPCATSQPRLCSYVQHAPRSDDGRMAWGLFNAGAHRVRTAGMGQIVGVETDGMVARLVAAGVDPDTADILIGACERGMVAAFSEKDED